MPSPATVACSFYLAALHSLRRSGIDFLVGGAYALERYTGISRDTKDLDVFVRPEDCERVLAAFAESGFDTELTFPHWLGKARAGSEGGRHLQLGQRLRSRRRRVVPTRSHRRGDGRSREAHPGRGDDLVERAHHGARALRRRRRDPSPARPRRRPRLVAGATALRLEVARPPLAPDPLRLRLSRPPRRHPHRRHA